MFALAISTGFIYPHVVALELTIRHWGLSTSAKVAQRPQGADAGLHRYFALPKNHRGLDRDAQMHAGH